MEQNTKCTIKDILCALKDAYLRGGEQDFWDDSGWHVYLSGAGDLLLETACITAPPAFNEETDEEILPEKMEWTVPFCRRSSKTLFAAQWNKNGMRPMRNCWKR